MAGQSTGEHLDHELKAVLVADVEGYTRLMSANEDDAHQLTSRCLDLFCKHPFLYRIHHQEYSSVFQLI